MAIVLNRIERMNPLTKIKKWYAVLKTISQVKESAVARQISEGPPLTVKKPKWL